MWSMLFLANPLHALALDKGHLLICAHTTLTAQLKNLSVSAAVAYAHSYALMQASLMTAFYTSIVGYMASLTEEAVIS